MYEFSRTLRGGGGQEKKRKEPTPSHLPFPGPGAILHRQPHISTLVFVGETMQFNENKSNLESGKSVLILFLS